MPTNYNKNCQKLQCLGAVLLYPPQKKNHCFSV